MELLNIFTAIGSAASGGLLGLFGNGIKLWADSKAEAAKRAFELAMRQADREEMQLEYDLQLKQTEATVAGQIAVANQQKQTTELQVEGDIQQSEMVLISNSYQHDRAQYGGGFVDSIRGLMRPTLTLYFAVLMSFIAYQLMVLTKGIVPEAEAYDLLKMVINACIFLTTTAVTWWFGSRPIKRG